MKLNEMIIRRQNHEPLAYIRNKTEFYGRNFYIDNRVLEPRPESETIIDMLKGLDLPGQTTIIDIGTGSGALAITAKLEIPHSKVVATDIDSRCLIVARKNIRKYGLDIQVFKGPLLDPLPVRQFAGNKTVLICNLPYVPDSFKLNLAALNEPKLAIFGGLDGLEVYQKLFEQCTELKFRPKFILTESMPPQHKKLSAIAAVNGFRLAKTNDFIQLFS
jgi:release factor glutamine methyltransferase